VRGAHPSPPAAAWDRPTRQLLDGAVRNGHLGGGSGSGSGSGSGGSGDGGGRHRWREAARAPRGGRRERADGGVAARPRAAAAAARARGGVRVDTLAGLLRELRGPHRRHKGGGEGVEA